MHACTARQHSAVKILDRSHLILIKMGEKSEDLNIATVCATINTGLEHLGNQECVEKLGSSSLSRTVKKFRGRIIFELPAQDIKKATQLRSVDNLSVVLNNISDVDLHQEKEQVIDDLCKKIIESNWKLALDTWRNFTKSELCLDPLPGKLPSASSKYVDAKTTPEVGIKDKNDDSPGEVPPKESSLREVPLADTPSEAIASEEVPQGESTTTVNRPTFRVTCTRTGEKHKFNSRDVAPAVGSLINETFGWPVKMKDYDIEVVVNIVEDSTMVSISLTKESMHRRNITHFGITTLKSTIAYCMLRMAQPQPGEVIIDPMCGVGGIPLEGLLDWKSCHVVAGDMNDVAVERTKANLDSLSERRRSVRIERPDIDNDVLQWDVTNLPLKSASVDVFVTDLPFGKRLGSRRNNWSLYHKCLEEMARVCRPGTGRAVLLTQDKKCMVQTLQRCHHIWRKKHVYFINHGGLKACIYLLQRPKVKQRRNKTDGQDEAGDLDEEEGMDESTEQDDEMQSS
ncbi:THUMP domain-containing protein 3-like isoform X1 [Lytechinus variegatus]|uniref:THUMP domain-containing protein 3-like isoform X1 n=1 Tax=Lytechinus variegatus TaxID=7654 RepID=UPI001BB1AB3D|nr:THUMP domain-containing protein 3-like isoform X1 [Lytechinus variegatus]